MTEQELFQAENNQAEQQVAKGVTSADATANEVVGSDGEETVGLVTFASAELVKLPFKEKWFPSVIRENLMTAPENRKVPILLACLSPLGALATRVRLTYPYDRTRKHAILLNTIFEAPPSTGKSAMADVANQIIEPTLQAMDEMQRRAEQEFREKRKNRASNEKIGQEPMTTIRCVPPHTSKTVIVKRADSYKRKLGDYLTFWMFAEELALLGDAGKSGFSNLRSVLRISYDLGSKFGQDFASDNSYSGIADVCISSMFLATPQDVDDVYTKREIVGGGCSRTMICVLQDDAGSDAAIFAPFKEEQIESIGSMLKRMMEETYDQIGGLRPVLELDTTWLNPSIYKWCGKIRDEIKRLCNLGAYGYRAMDAFYKRSSVNAFRSAGLMYYMYLLEESGAVYSAGKTDHLLTVDETLARLESGEHERLSLRQIRKNCMKFYLFLADYCLGSSMKRWGKQYEEFYHDRIKGAKIDKRKPLFEQLTTTFTREQIDMLIERNELDTESRFYLSQWKAKGWIVQSGKNVYQKTQ